MPADQQTIKKISIASIIMMASVFASRLIGVFREMTIAGVGGIHSGVDAYQISFVIPEILNHIVASGFLSITFIPMFTKYLAEDRTEEGWKIFSIIHNSFGALLTVFIGICMVWTPQLIALLAPGIQDEQTLALAVKMTRIILPAQFFFFSGGLFMAVQFAHEKFALPALAPLIYNLFIILGGLLLGPALGMEGFAWGVLAGAFLGNFALQVVGAAKEGARYRLIFDFSHPDLKRYILVTLPLMLGLTMTFSIEIQFKFFGSFLPEGSIAALNYALRVMMIFVGLFGQAVGVAAYPFLAKYAASGQMDKLNDLLNRTLKMIFLVLPISVLVIVLRNEIIQILFQRGQFDAEATRITAGILPFFMIGAFAFSAQALVNRGYYAQENTLFPTLLTSGCVLLFLWPLYLSMKTFGACGLAGMLSVSIVFQVLLLFESWSRESGNSRKADVYLFFFKTLLISIVIALPLYVTHELLVRFLPVQAFAGTFAVCVVTGLEFILIFYLAGRMLKISEIQNLFQNVIRRLLPWKKRSSASQTK